MKELKKFNDSILQPYQESRVGQDGLQLVS